MSTLPILTLLLFLILFSVDASSNAGDIGTGRRTVEESIPIIEIRGEGKPMSSAQIRHLEEMDNGKPLDIKMEKTHVPARCPNTASRLDFVTFQYKVFTEDGKKVHQTYGIGPVTVQLGTGMIMPGLDKGLRGMCEDELRKIEVPYRLSRKSKSRVWKNIPNDEHWLTFNIEMVSVKKYTHENQFAFLDMNNDTMLVESELVDWVKTMRKEYGKKWNNEDIDNVTAVKYYIKYFDTNKNGKVTFDEWESVMSRDEQKMSNVRSKAKGRKRDPGVAWVLDFNNDGIVSYEELDAAADRLERDPPTDTKKDEL